MRFREIKVNRAQCRKCGDIIESTHRHDFRSCKCGTIYVDGGKEYLRRVGDLDQIIEMSEFEDVEEYEENSDCHTKES